MTKIFVYFDQKHCAYCHALMEKYIDKPDNLVQLYLCKEKLEKMIF